jgi:hypothetical protein
MGDTRVASVVIRVMESGTIWLKDVELWHIPALPAPPAVVGEVVLKRIDPKEKPFSVGGFFQGKISEDRWAFRSETLGRTVRLHVLEKPNADGDQLTLRARLLGGNDTGAGTCTGAHLQLVGHFAGGAVVTSTKPTLLLKGSTSWQPFQATLTIPKGLRLERVEMNLVMFPHAGESAMLDYFVAVKDIELVKSPPTGPPQPVVLRTFDPVKDKVLHGDAKTEEGGWRIKYDGNAHQGHVRLFRVADLTVPKEGKFIFRATLKAQRSPSFKSEFTFGVFLSMGPERLPFAPGSGARDVNSLEWTTYEVVYPTSKFKDIGATGLPLDLMVLGNGTVWVKDIELLYAPETK